MTHPSVTSIPAQFIGLDVGDRLTHVCGLDGERRVVERTRIATTREALLAAFADHPPARIVLEVGSQSPWLSALLRELGHDVLVADARRVAAITRSGRKTDRRDAETLARLLAGMPELLGSVRHRGRQAQADLALIRARDVFVQTSTRCRQHVRGVLKSFGLRMPKCSGRAFRKAALEVIPEELQPALLPVLAQLEAVERTIHDYDRRIEQLGTERHPDTARLRQVNSVGPLVSLAFVLTIDDPKRFAKSRDVGSFLGLCPRVQASGDSDPQLPISKTGCGYMRRLLVQSAQYILGPFGKDSDLRRFGLRLCERGGKAAKRRAVVAVARKLAVLLHRLWVSGAPYEPLRNAKPA